MFRHAADLTIVSFSTVLVIRSLHVPPDGRTHTSGTHWHTTGTFFARRTRKGKHTQSHTAQHYFMMAKNANTDTFHSSLRLCLADTGRATR